MLIGSMAFVCVCVQNYIVIRKSNVDLFCRVSTEEKLRKLGSFLYFAYDKCGEGRVRGNSLGVRAHGFTTRAPRESDLGCFRAEPNQCNTKWVIE